MVSFEVRRMRRPVIALTLVACVPSIASSQPGSVTEEQRRIVAERIEQARAQGGPYSKELIDPLTSLAEIYQQSGNEDLAAAATEQALQVIRANYGLRSLDQVPLIRARIQGEEARGNAAEAWNLEQALLILARANLGDVRAADVFGEIGDKRIEVLRRYNAGGLPPQVQLGCYYKRPTAANYNPDVEFRHYMPDGSCTSGSRRVAATAMLADAQRNYAAAISVLRRAGQFSSAELRDRELDLIRSTYVYGAHYQTGRDSFRRLISYAVASAEPLTTRANALVQMSDWDLLYGHRPLALETYEATYDFLQREGVETAAIDALFSPEVPVVLPAFQENPLATSPGDEHIDVSFEITRFGTTGRVRVRAKTTNASDEAEERLVRLIERRQFRPRVVAGEFPRSTPVVVRYYLND